METMEQFLAKQAAELEKKRQEIAEFEALGPVPGLDPWLIYGKLYGIRGIGYKLADLAAFIEWGKANARKIYAVEGFYKGFYPEIPATKDYADASIKAEGDVEVTYSTIMRAFSVEVYVGQYKLRFELKDYKPDLIPKANYRSYSDRYNGERKIDQWFKTGAGVRQYLRVGTDRQSADLETLLTWEQFEGYFLPKAQEVAA